MSELEALRRRVSVLEQSGLPPDGPSSNSLSTPSQGGRPFRSTTVNDEGIKQSSQDAGKRNHIFHEIALTFHRHDSGIYGPRHGQTAGISGVNE